MGKGPLREYTRRVWYSVLLTLSHRAIILFVIVAACQARSRSCGKPCELYRRSGDFAGMFEKAPSSTRLQVSVTFVEYASGGMEYWKVMFRGSQAVSGLSRINSKQQESPADALTSPTKGLPSSCIQILMSGAMCDCEILCPGLLP